MKRKVRDNDLPLIIIGLLLISASILLSFYEDGLNGIALFEIGALILSGGILLLVTRYV
jgi:hypothetical protein